MKIRSRLILLLLVCSLLPLVIITLNAYQTSRELLRSQITEALESTAERVSTELQREFDRGAADLTTWTQLLIMQDVMTDDGGGELTNQLQRLQRFNPQFMRLDVFNDQGILIASSDDSLIGQQPELEWLQLTAKGKRYQGDVGPDFASDQLGLTIALPIRAEYDEELIIGTLVGSFDWGRIQQQLSEILITGSPQDRDHQVLLLDHQKAEVLFASSDSDGQRFYEQLAPAAEHTPGQPEGHNDLLSHQTSYMVASHHSQDQPLFRDPHWQLSVLISLDEAFQTIDALKQQFWLYGGGLILFILLLGALFLRSITRPFVSLKSAVAVIEAHSRQLAETAHSSRNSAQQQQNNADLVEAAAEQLTHTLAEAVTNSQNSSSQADIAQQHALEGQQLGTQTTEIIDRMVAHVNTAVATTERFQRRTEQMREMLEVIEAIAYRTQLLAFNASIEAARASEHGRGFAVVAQEVRTLSENAKHSTEDIQAQITALKNEVMEHSDAIGTCRRFASDSVSAVRQMQAGLEAIATANQRVNQLSSEVVSADQNNLQAANSILDHLAEIAAITRTNSLQADTSLSSSRELLQLSAELRDMIARNL